MDKTYTSTTMRWLKMKNITRHFGLPCPNKKLKTSTQHSRRSNRSNRFIRQLHKESQCIFLSLMRSQYSSLSMLCTLKLRATQFHKSSSSKTNSDHTNHNNPFNKSTWTFRGAMRSAQAQLSLLIAHIQFTWDAATARMMEWQRLEWSPVFVQSLPAGFAVFLGYGSAPRVLFASMDLRMWLINAIDVIM